MLRKLVVRCIPIALVCCFSAFSVAAEPPVNWDRLGGPKGDFQADDDRIPTKWDAGNVVWKSEIGGVGQSSPVTWGDRIFLTSSESAGGKVSRIVLALDRATGDVVWRKTVATGPGENVHKMNSYASASCATDGERVVAYFGPGGLHCLDLDGKKLWSLDLVKPTGPFGFGGSPIILGDLVIQNCDAEGPSYLIAVNKENGETVWKATRKNSPKGGWSTPILIDTGKRKELVMNGEFGVQAYNPSTGEDLWFCKSFNGRGTPMPAWANGVLVLINGKPGDAYGVRPGGTGDVTATHMAWHTRRGGGRDLSSPVAVGEFAFVVNMKGVGTLYRASSGEEVWVDRVGGNYSATPLVANGLIYVIDEAGTTNIIKPGAKLDVIAKNPLGDVGDEIFRSSPTPSRGQLLLRSNKSLYCVAAK